MLTYDCAGDEDDEAKMLAAKGHTPQAHRGGGDALEEDLERAAREALALVDDD